MSELPKKLELGYGAACGVVLSYKTAEGEDLNIARECDGPKKEILQEIFRRYNNFEDLLDELKRLEWIKPSGYDLAYCPRCFRAEHSPDCPLQKTVAQAKKG